MNNNKERYVKTLMSCVDLSLDYFCLCDMMYNTEFIPYFNTDNIDVEISDNDRVLDAGNLRDKYYYLQTDEMWEHPTSLLEVLISFIIYLAPRNMSDEHITETMLRDYDYDINLLLSKELMVELLANLDMLDFTNANFFESTNGDEFIKKASESIRILIDREYDEYGVGGLFPLEYSDIDSRIEPLSTQARCYFAEKFINSTSNNVDY